MSPQNQAIETAFNALSTLETLSKSRNHRDAYCSAVNNAVKIIEASLVNITAAQLNTRQLAHLITKLNEMSAAIEPIITTMKHLFPSQQMLAEKIEPLADCKKTIEAKKAFILKEAKRIDYEKKKAQEKLNRRIKDFDLMDITNIPSQLQSNIDVIQQEANKETAEKLTVILLKKVSNFLIIENNQTNVNDSLVLNEVSTLLEKFFNDSMKMLSPHLRSKAMVSYTDIQHTLEKRTAASVTPDESEASSSSDKIVAPTQASTHAKTPEPSDRIVHSRLQTRAEVDRNNQLLFVINSFKNITINTQGKSTGTLEREINEHILNLEIGPKEAQEALFGLNRYSRYLLKYHPRSATLLYVETLQSTFLEIKREKIQLKNDLKIASNNLRLFGERARARKTTSELLTMADDQPLASRDRSPVRKHK